MNLNIFDFFFFNWICINNIIFLDKNRDPNNGNNNNGNNIIQALLYTIVVWN